MPYKSLQQLTDEQKVHHKLALKFFREAAEIREKLNAAISLTEFLDLQRQWLEKLAQGSAETEKSIKLSKQYIEELERLKNRDLN